MATNLNYAQFTVLEQNAESYATLEDIKQKLDYSAIKLLSISQDPLIDSSVLDSSGSYSVQ
jgi:hypothetical protein